MPSPVPPSSFCEAVPASNADFCTRFTRFLGVPQLLCDLFSWMFNADGTLSQNFQSEAAQYSTPTGAYMYFATMNVGEGWLYCLSPQTKVLLSDGTYKTIKEIVDRKLEVDVASVDPDTGTLVGARVSGWSKNKAKRDEWYRISFVGSSNGKFDGSGLWKVDATDNHAFMTTRGWVQVKDLNESDRILRRQPTLTQAGQEAVIGMYLGDGSINKSRFTVTHGDSQSDYIKFIAGKFDSKVSRGVYYNGFVKGSHSRLTTRLSLKTFCPELIPLLNRSKTSLRECLNRIGPLGLAHWYMDDGSLGKDNRGASVSYRMCLHTQGMNSECLDEVKRFFMDRFGVTAKTYACKQCSQKDGRGKMVAFSPSDSAVLFDAISQYVIPSMQYKIPDIHLKQCILESVDYVKVGLVEYGFKKTHVSKLKDRDLRVRWKYDITVDRTHCFFANDILVHNCDGREVSRTTYATLFAAIGTVHGAGDGTTTFNLPDGRGRSLIGSGTGDGLSAFRDINSPYAGEETHVQTVSEMPVHSHTLTVPVNKTGENGEGVANHWRQSDPTGTTDPAGSGTPMNITHACLVAHLHIKI